MFFQWYLSLFSGVNILSMVCIMVFLNGIYYQWEYIYIYTILCIYICIYIIHVYACGPKTVPVKRTFLNIAIVGWGGGGMLTFLVLRTWNIATLLRSLGSFTTLHVATLLMGWGGVGWGGHVNVPCTSYMKYCHAAEISGIVYYVTCCYAADGMGWGGVGVLSKSEW